MGNASSLLGGSYEVEDAFPELTSDGQKGQGQGWSLQLAENSDGRRVSIFLYPTNEANGEYVDNAVKYFRMLRHPGIPKFLDMKHNANGCMLITERVKPLEFQLPKLTATEICAGLYNIIEVLAFLHDRGAVCHNNIGLSAIFVGSNGRWMLGGLEYMCQFDEATAAYLDKCKSFRNQNSLAPEEKEGRVQVSTKSGWARDTYAFGILAEYLLTYLDDLGDLTKTFELRVQDECLNSDPSQRPHMSSLLQDRLFKIDYLEIINFLQNITVKTEEEKKSFFSSAARKLFHLPSAVIATRLVRPLLSRFVLLDSTANTCLVPHLLTPYKGTRVSDDFKDDRLNPILPEELFQRYVIPELFRVFHVYNVHIRLTLLRQFESYVHLFDRDTLQEFIFPQVLVGLRDSCDDLATASLRAVACLVPILGGDIVISANRTKLFSGTTPNFSKKLNHMQEKGTDVMTETNISNGIMDKKTDDVAIDQKEHRRKLLEQRREERRRLQEEKEKKHAKASQNNITDVTVEEQNHCSEENHISDSRLDAEQSHDAVEEKMRDIDDITSDYDFDNEIEEELEAMDSVVVLKRDKNVEMGPPVKVDWSDVAATPTKTKNWGAEEKGVLRLKGHCSNPDKVVISTKDNASTVSARDVDGDIRTESSMVGCSDTPDDHWDTTEDWEGVDTCHKPQPTHVPSARFSSPPKTLVDKAKHKRGSQKLSTTSPHNDALGAEFDVMAIEVQRKTMSATADPIEQLFAEMQPTIASSGGGGGLLSMLGKTGGNRSGQQSQVDDTKMKTKASLLFAANDIPDGDSDGWGDDLNWNVSDD